MSGGGGRLLEGRCAVVTGAARGIGRAVAHRLAEEGAAVAILDLDGDAAQAAASDIAERTGAATTAVAADVADPASVAAAAGATTERLGLCDVVVANAGVLLLRPALDTTAEAFERVVRVNLLGAFVTATEWSRRLRDAGRPGSVIFSSSLFGVRGGAGNTAYSASKFGLLGITESMAAELAPHGIRVNAVCPGQVDTEMLDQLLAERAGPGGDPAGERARMAARVPLGRLASVREIADAYVYLASDLAAYVTGQRIVVDGGWQVS